MHRYRKIAILIILFFAIAFNLAIENHSAPTPAISEVLSEPAPTPIPTAYINDSETVDMLAKLVWGEGRGIKSKARQAAIIWTVLNRADKYDKPIEAIVTASGQFVGYKAAHPATEELKALADDVLTRWKKEKDGQSDVGRVLPKGFIYFTGDGKENYFRDSYYSTDYWQWTLPDPYTKES